MTDSKPMPALSRAEWDANEKRIRDAEGVVGLMYTDTSNGARLYTSASGHAGIVRPELLHAAIALANDALPDDHPGKLVRADLGMADPLLRAKLEALLRP
jgi:hypothetical protein